MAEEKIVIIRYNAGNVQSVLFALERLGFDAQVSDDHETIMQAEKVIFPGVGNAGTAMASLREKGLDKVIKELKQPLLGICVGMQLLCKYSEEENTECLGIIDLNVKKFVSGDPKIKVPHVGWNEISPEESPLFRGLTSPAYVYFVHSFYAETGSQSIARTNYIHPFSAAIQKDNFFGVQFHAEKSAAVGDQILLNFLNMKPWR